MEEIGHDIHTQEFQEKENFNNKPKKHKDKQEKH